MRMNKGGKPDSLRCDDIEELQMREPPGYLGIIVRRIKQRAEMERDALRQAEMRRAKMRGRAVSRGATQH
ncbi:MAG TPA: hypothetical protein VGM68_08775 [Rhizomicrobium sp.]